MIQQGANFERTLVGGKGTTQIRLVFEHIQMGELWLYAVSTGRIHCIHCTLLSCYRCRPHHPRPHTGQLMELNHRLPRVPCNLKE